MTITLDPATEDRIAQRIQHEIDRGHFHTPAEVIEHALDLLSADTSGSDEEKAYLDQRYDRGTAQFDRGEGIPGDQVRQALAELRTTHAAL